MKEERVEVLVSGAGPVGMLTAALLSKGGVRVRIIDQESRTSSRTYACALHPRTLALLGRLGWSRELLALGKQVSGVAFYQGSTRRAEVRLSQLASEFPFVLVVPQSGFEQLLEERLKSECGLRVEWNHRLSDLQMESQGVRAAVDTLGMSAKGYSVPEMQVEVSKTQRLQASYVIGADGPKSLLAESLRIPFESTGEPEFFAVYEFDSDERVGNELRVVLDKGSTSVLWPLSDSRLRWSFQLKEEHLREFPAKERKSLLVDQPALDKANRKFVERLVQERAPWFKGSIGELGWSTDVEFQPRVATRFGDQRCWLVGDAAHQTGPGGMQSMNRGLLEAERLAEALVKIIRQNASSDLLAQYNEACREEWRCLLGMGHALQTRPTTDPWVKEHRAGLLECLPSTGEDLRVLLDQLKLDLV